MSPYSKAVCVCGARGCCSCWCVAGPLWSLNAPLDAWLNTQHEFHATAAEQLAQLQHAPRNRLSKRNEKKGKRVEFSIRLKSIFSTHTWAVYFLLWLLLLLLLVFHLFDTSCILVNNIRWVPSSWVPQVNKMCVCVYVSGCACGL